ncbi:MAG: tetratricopeptide repeat protein [Chloroflexota bacterium]
MQQSKSSNLPLQSTPFIGRREEIAEIVKQLSDPGCQLLTLVGPGGIGKTRLALQLASMSSETFKRRSFVVYLQPLRSGEFFIPAIADALGLPLMGQEPALVQLGQYLFDKEAFIILDNFEHLPDAVDQLSVLLPSTPQIKYLITSREALNLKEEWLYPVLGLTFPEKLGAKSIEQNYDAVQFFNKQAQRVYADFSPAEEEEAIVRICQLVDGMPLALELAAAWRKTLACQEIADEIQSNLEFLTTRLRNLPERHHSMQTVFDQTWQRLTEEEQEVFNRLSVFRGGFQRDAADNVTGASLPILSALVDKSLLRLDADGRYQIHELLRQFAAEQLEKKVGDIQQAQVDHANYFIQFLHQRSKDVAGGRQREALLEIKQELDNIRAAWLWAVAAVDADALAKGSEPLGLYYQYLGGYLEGLTLFSQAAEVLNAQPQSEVRDLALLGVLMYQGWYHLRFGRYQGTEACMVQMQTIYQRLKIPPLPGNITDPNAPLSFVALARGDYAAAVEYAEQVRQVAELQKHAINRQFAYHLLAEANLGLGEYEVALVFAQQAYAQALISGDRWFMAYILNNMGQIAVALGDKKMGKTHFQASYEIRQSFDDPEGMALALINLGNIALKEGSFAEAEEHYQRSRGIYQDINDKGGLAAANQGLGIVFNQQDEVALSQSYFQQALHLAVDIDYRRVLFSLMVHIAELLWKLGQIERPLILLAFAVNHPSSDYDLQSQAKTLIIKYQKTTPPEIFSAATIKGEESDLGPLTSDLLNQLSLPLMRPSEGVVLPTEPTQNLIQPLTPREFDVLKLLCEGLTNSEIADELVLAIGTVKFYSGQIYRKLGVRNRVMAVTRARELDLINPE